MAKILHNNFIDTVNDIVSQAKKEKIIHLQYDADHWEGRYMHIDNRDLLNFGTCGYLGLEVHQELKKRAIEYTEKFGTQFSISRAYVTSNINVELENRISQIFDGHPCITFSSTSIAHVSVLPIVISPEDAIIVDQQAHVSMQTAAQLMAAKGVPVEIIRHSNLEMLEHKLKKLQTKYNKVWYIIDGVYSMYGDLAPYDELNELAKKYDSLHFYVDDAHGMSWTGEKGSGSTFSTFKENGKTILVTTMAKGFGSLGGVVVFPDQEAYNRVNIHGGPLAYSHPIAPAVIGASMASADIHLSREIDTLQAELKERIKYCNYLLDDTGIPVLSDKRTPIYFIGTGQPKVGYNLNKRVLHEGYYVNIGMFPAVSVKNTGLRFTITNHIEKSDITAFVEMLAKHYPQALHEEGTDVNQVRKVFKLPEVDPAIFKDALENHIPFFDEELFEKLDEEKEELRVFTRNTIKDIDKNIWNSAFKDKGNFDWDALKMMEEAFSNNELPEENWKFHYVLVFDSNGELVLATFLTSGLFKDDLVSPVEVSRIVEEQRKKDPYYLCSKTMTMGSLFSEGNHLYIDKDKTDWKKAVKLMLESLSEIQTEDNLNAMILRDFYHDDPELIEIFHAYGLFKIELPNSNVIYNLDEIKEDEFIESLTARSRRHIRTDVLKNEKAFQIEIVDKLSSEELEYAYALYRNVGSNNNALNVFPYPFKLCQLMNESKDWEFIKLYLKDERLSAVGFCYRSGKDYFPVLVGLDYSLNREFKVYKQMLYRVVMRAIRANCSTIHFGFSADTEKRKLGAKQLTNVGFMEIKDNFNFEILNNITA